MTNVQQTMALQAEEHDKQAARFQRIYAEEVGNGRSGGICGDGVPEGASMMDVAAAHAVVAQLIRNHLGITR